MRQGDPALRMVLGFMAPDSGDILFGERRMNDGQRRISATPHGVPELRAVPAPATVAENIAFGLKMRKIPAVRRTRRIGEAIETVSLRGLETRRPGQLSGSQQQRAGAGALSIVTQLTSCSTGRCPAPRRKTARKSGWKSANCEKAGRHHAHHVTHDQVEALAISDRIVVMNKGRIEQVGRREALYRSPLTSFVADFLGAANIVSGTAAGDHLVATPMASFGGAEAETRRQAAEGGLAAEDMRVAAPERRRTSSAPGCAVWSFAAVSSNSCSTRPASSCAPRSTQVSRNAKATYSISRCPRTARAGGRVSAMRTDRLTLLLLILPGAGFIFLFLAAAIAMTVLQSVGLYSLVGESS